MAKKQTPGRPNTPAELNALPEGFPWDGVAVFHDLDDIIKWADEEGRYWRIGRHLDGRWFKRPA